MKRVQQSSALRLDQGRASALRLHHTVAVASHGFMRIEDVTIAAYVTCIAMIGSTRNEHHGSGSSMGVSKQSVSKPLSNTRTATVSLRGKYRYGVAVTLGAAVRLFKNRSPQGPTGAALQTGGLTTSGPVLLPPPVGSLENALQRLLQGANGFISTASAGRASRDALGATTASTYSPQAPTYGCAEALSTADMLFRLRGRHVRAPGQSHMEGHFDMLSHTSGTRARAAVCECTGSTRVRALCSRATEPSGLPSTTAEDVHAGRACGAAAGRTDQATGCCLSSKSRVQVWAIISKR